MQPSFLNDFLDLQRKSFFYLLEYGLMEEFVRRNPLRAVFRPENHELNDDSTPYFQSEYAEESTLDESKSSTDAEETEVIFHAQSYRLALPSFTPQQAILRGKSYVAKLYMPIQLRAHQHNVLKWVLLGHVPLMTKRGHFILNGAPRVVVNQILRSPGLYYREKLHETFRDKWSETPDEVCKRYYADIICMRGTWLRLEIEKDRSIWVRTKKGPKIPVAWLLIAMGLNERMILQSLPQAHRFLGQNTNDFGGTSFADGNDDMMGEIENENDYAYVTNPAQAWAELSALLGLKRPSRYGKNDDNAESLGRQWVFNRFMNPRTYDLGKAGRRSLNQQLGLQISPQQTTLTAQDVLYAAHGLLEVEQGFRKIDDIDHLKRRRVRTCGELLQMQLGIGLLRLEKQLQRGSQDGATAGSIFPPGEHHASRHDSQGEWGTSTREGVDATMDEHSSMELLQIDSEIMEKESQLTEPLFSTKPINGALREFFSTSPLSQFLDQINPLSDITHKRRLTSMGPGGITRDNATLAVRSIHPTHYGRICPVETPEGKNTGLVSSITTYAQVNPHGFIETPFYRVYQGQVQRQAGLYYLSAEQEERIHSATGDLRFTRAGFLAGTRIPVKIGHEFKTKSPDQVDYVAVAPIQMISVATALIPFLEHDDGNRALMGSNMQRQAVPLLRAERPRVKTGLEVRAISDSGHALQSSVSGYICYVSAEKISVMVPASESGVFCANAQHLVHYVLQPYQRSNQDTYLVHRPAVRVGDWVQAGDLLADASTSMGGELSLGSNILVAYVPWEGYNYEDAILISERLVFDDVYTSIHIEKYETEIQMTPLGWEQITRDVPDVDEEQLTHLDTRGICKLGTWVKEGDILVGKRSPIDKSGQSPYQKLLYTILEKEWLPFKDTSLRAPKGIRAQVLDISMELKPDGSSDLTDQFPDEMTEDATNGRTSKRIIRNASGTRKASHLPLATLDEPFMVRVYLAEKRRINIGDKMAGRHGNKGIVSQILPMQDMPYLPDGTPVDMVLNPLGVPSRMNVGQIYECLLGLAGKRLGETFQVLPFDEIYGAEASRSFVYAKLREASQTTAAPWLFNANTPGKVYLFDGRTGECFDQSVTVGEAYMLKLVHMVDDKIHARSTGPYALVTQQPLRGRSKHGGQRVGEMEVWALEGYGAAFTLLEMLTLKSDDMTGRMKLWSNIVLNKPIGLGTPESFKVMVSELQALCLHIGLYRRDESQRLREVVHVMNLRS